MMRQSLVLQTPGKPFTHKLQCHPFSNSSNPSCEQSGTAAFFEGGIRGTPTSVETPTTIKFLIIAVSFIYRDHRS